MRKSKGELYIKVSNAREACAGSAVRNTKIVRERINTALKYALELNGEATILIKLREARRVMKNVRDRDNRLASRVSADSILCSILNNELKGFG